MKRATFAMLTMLVCASAPLTVDEAYGQEPGDPSQLGQFDFFVGDWNCTGQVFAHGTTSARATSARAHGEKAAGDRWVLFRYDEVKTAANQRPFHIDQYFGYDPAAKTFVSVAVDTGGYFTETSPGWNGDSITFDEVADGAVVGHDTFTRNRQGEITHSGADKDKDGNWIKTDEETCHRM